MAGKVLVGTSSWADPGFVEEWYPKGMAARDRLAWYAERFDAVEVNATFYAVPDRKTVERWVDQTPDGFTFDVKLHRLLSRHSAPLESLPKPLREQATTTERGRVKLTDDLEAAMADATLEACAPLADNDRLAVFLLQLSPGFEPRKHELDELAPLLERLAPHPVAIEPRHRAWVKGDAVERTLEWFEEHGAAWVGVDAPQGKAPTMMPPLDAATRDDVAYLRAHGRNAEGYMKGRSVAERFGWEYDDDELGELKERAEELANEVPVVHMMFNNNRGADAPKAAARMRELLGQA
jgi:uncharacterized protein YecE (DUF72 family)